jgi:RND family efflux transporter MFP subunit
MLRRAACLAAHLVTLAVVTGCAILPTGPSREALQEEPTPTPIPTPIVPTKPVYQVQTGEVVKKLQFTGRIAPVVEQELFFRTNGRVRRVYIKRDDVVTATQVLADLEIDNLERDLSAGQLELERAQVRLAEAERQLQSNIKRAQLNLEIAQLDLASLKAQDPAPRRVQAAADLQKTTIELKTAQEAYNAIAYADDRGSSREAAALQQATLNYEQAKADYDLALQSINNHDNDVAIKEREVALAQLALDDLSAGVDPLLKNDVQQAELNVQKLKASITDAEIIAPFNGEVSSVTLTEGREATAYKPVVTVADPSTLEVSADLTSDEMNDLAENMPVSVMLVSRPGQEISGTIRRLPYPYGGGGRITTGTDTTDEDKSTRVTLSKTAAEAGFEVGDLCRVTVVLEHKDSVLWLPPQAIRTFEGRKFVVVQDGEAQRRVDVTIGIESDERVEIKEGLTAGLTVVGQ